MKKIYAFAAVLLFGSALISAAEKNVSYLSDIQITNKEFAKKGKEVVLTMDMDLSNLKLNLQQTMSITPVIVSKDGSRELEFPPVVIDGKIRDKVYQRSMILESAEIPPYHSDDAQIIIRRYNRKEQSYSYEAARPYERWMLDGNVILREDVHGCVNCPKGKSTSSFMDDVLPEFIPEYRLGKVEPEPEPVKVREEARVARINFEWDRYEILPDFKNNRAELDTVANSILLVKDNPDVTITGIFIDGYASPEGTIAHNETLSKNRAYALSEYIHDNVKVDGGLLNVSWHGEDWDGFKAMILDEGRLPGLTRREEVVNILRESKGNSDEIQKEIEVLDPQSEIYRVILGTLYPELRRNEYRIVYDVRNFNLEEARKVILENPKLLSVSEMYMVAGSYEKGSEEYVRTMKIAAECYPNSAAVVNDAALELIGAEDYSGAVRFLEASRLTKDSPMLLNTLGVAYANAGEPLKAEEAFAPAAQAGLDEAVHNLGQVKNVIEQL